MPTTITSTRKNVAKPSTESNPPNAGPACAYAATEPNSAAIKASRLRFPNRADERRFTTGSRIMSSVAATVRISSGRNRTISPGLTTALTGTGDLLGGGHGYPERNVDLRLIEHARVRFRHRRQKRLRIHTHPNHHHDQRNHRYPFPHVHVGHVQAHFLP